MHYYRVFFLSIRTFLSRLRITELKQNKGFRYFLFTTYRGRIVFSAWNEIPIIPTRVHIHVYRSGHVTWKIVHQAVSGITFLVNFTRNQFCDSNQFHSIFLKNCKSFFYFTTLIYHIINLITIIVDIRDNLHCIYIYIVQS